MSRELDSGHIVATAGAIQRRISERFPDSGLGRVSAELVAIATESEARLERLRRPYWPMRVLAAVGVVTVIGVAVAAVLTVQVRGGVETVSSFLQGLEAAINDVVLVGIAVWFLLTVEARWKRRLALRALHELRSVAHIIDMHQLTKDPEQVLSPARSTASSPVRLLSRFELARYLDYCSELLAITSKLAALHVQHLNDPVVLAAVNDVQGLTSGLSAKIWQKITILDIAAPIPLPSPSHAP